jgi:hypothetical protein
MRQLLPCRLRSKRESYKLPRYFTLNRILGFVDTTFLKLFLQLYPEQLQQTRTIESFMQGVWTMIGNNNMPGLSDDGVGCFVVWRDQSLIYVWS